MALISKEELEEMYWGESGTEMGAYLIADEIGCGTTTIYRYLKKYNIPTRPPSTENNECFTKESLRKKSELKKGENHHQYGVELEEKTKEKISQTLSKEQKGQKNSFFRKKHSKKSKEKMRAKKTGLKNSSSKVNKEQGLEIYNKYKKRIKNIPGLAKEYNLGNSTIWRIVNGKHWTTKHLSDKNKRMESEKHGKFGCVNW